LQEGGGPVPCVPGTQDQGLSALSLLDPGALYLSGTGQVLKDPGLRLRTKGTVLDTVLDRTVQGRTVQRTGQVPFLPTPEGGGFRAEDSVRVI
jgi:hypothetical protein